MSDTAFDYVARDASGARKSGRISGADKREAALALKAQGLQPVRLSASATAPVQDAALTLPKATEFAGRLARLTQRRIPLDRALGLIAEGRTGPMKTAAAAARASLRDGASPAEALGGPGGLSDPACRAILTASEATGALDSALASVHGMLDTRLTLRRKIVTEMIYPAILLVVAAASIAVILVAIIPQFRPLVEGRMDLVPALGRAVFALSAFVSWIWPLLLLGTAATTGAAIWLARRGRLMPILTAAAQRIPPLRRLNARNQGAQALTLLGSLLERRVQLDTALAVLVEATPADSPLHPTLQKIGEEVQSGTPLWQALDTANLLDGDAIETIRIGEEAGDLPDMVARAAADLREARSRATERFMLLFQPALIVIVGATIGVSLYALFSAITAVNAISF
ncbi:type II secretion system F family protein [Aestuariibius sp. 2305UL40-4]|uniref:type II secretion system F family protein n=1 Tax=Aestuariibius violaceus TaxID=3234132 RepID=UPI00345EEF32